MKEIEIYTFGVGKQHEAGGYGVLIKDGQNKAQFAQGFQQTTTNRMQMMACIVGLEKLREPCRVQLFSSAEYIVNSVNNGWAVKWRNHSWTRKEGPVQNVDLWKRLLYLIERYYTTFDWISTKVKNPYLEHCRKLAVNAMNDNEKLKDEGYHQSRETLEEWESRQERRARREESIAELYGYEDSDEFAFHAAFEGEVGATFGRDGWY